MTRTPTRSRGKAGARAPGRPPKTSTDEIVACAIALLKSAPDAAISINRIAREIGIAPMAIYNYFANRDELLQAVTERMMVGLRYTAPASATWREKIAGWAQAVRAHFRRYPHLIHLLTWEGHASVAWQQRASVISDVLAQTGLRDHELAQAALWLETTIMGAVLAELTDRASPRIASHEDLIRLEEPRRSHLRAMLHYTKGGRHHNQAFRYGLDRALDALEIIIARANPEPPRHEPT